MPHTNEMKNIKNPFILHANCIIVKKLGIISHGNNFVHINNDKNANTKNVVYISLYFLSTLLKQKIVEISRIVITSPNE